MLSYYLQVNIYFSGRVIEIKDKINILFGKERERQRQRQRQREIYIRLGGGKGWGRGEAGYKACKDPENRVTHHCPVNRGSNSNRSSSLGGTYPKKVWGGV